MLTPPPPPVSPLSQMLSCVRLSVMPLGRARLNMVTGAAHIASAGRHFQTLRIDNVGGFVVAATAFSIVLFQGSLSPSMAGK